LAASAWNRPTAAGLCRAVSGAESAWVKQVACRVGRWFPLLLVDVFSRSFYAINALFAFVCYKPDDEERRLQVPIVGCNSRR